MKLLSTTILTFFLAMTTGFSQLVYVNSPEELVGGYTFGTASFGRLLTDTIITADVVFVDDGSGETASQGCQAATNGAELAGKIALIDRGTCEFGLKALNAEMAGAIGFIIFNNQPGVGVITMGAGANGGSVTIPGAMLDYETGQAFRAALENGAVNVTMGNLILDNDVAATANNVLVAPYGIVPIGEVDNGNFVFIPGANVRNAGFNDASNLSVSAQIEYAQLDGSGAVEVYNESALLEETLPKDSVSSLAILPDFEPANGIGVYTVSYEVDSDSTDQLDFNNRPEITFTVSDSLYSKASWDPETGFPNTTIYYSTGGGGVFEMLAPFVFSNASSGLRIDTVIANVLSPTGSVLAGEGFDAFVYEWNDLDADGAVISGEVSQVGVASYIFPEDFAEQAGTLVLPLLNFANFAEPGPTVNPDATAYFVGIRYVGETQAFIGVDESYSHEQRVNLLEEEGVLSSADFPYLVSSDISEETNSPVFEGAGLFTDVFGAASIGIKLAPIAVSTKEVVGPEVFELELFPNPATDYLQANIAFKQRTAYVEYHITDAQGRLVFSTRDNEVSDTEQAQFDLKALPSGQYFLTIRTEQGLQAKPFVVKR